jgi:predicted ABC-type ATPase
MPHVIIIAGPNGAGKSTVAPALLKDKLHVDNFVNADVLAQGLCAYQPEKAAIQAGRIMLDRIHLLANEKLNFAFETTLASRTFAIWIPKLLEQGYQFHLLFLWLQNAEIAVFRVKERIKTGGHFVREEIIRRRYTSGLKNFFHLYRPLADSWQFYDNSNSNYPSLIASGVKHDSLIIIDKDKWKKLLEVSNE